MNALLHALDPLLLGDVQLLPAARADVRAPGVGRVIPHVNRQLAVFQFGDLVDTLVEQIAVVRDDHHRAAVRPHQTFEPLLGVQIEVIVRLVQQQNIRLLDHQPHQRHQLFLPAAQRSRSANRDPPS